jgi:hypothetical protein
MTLVQEIGRTTFRPCGRDGLISVRNVPFFIFLAALLGFIGARVGRGNSSA